MSSSASSMPDMLSIVCCALWASSAVFSSLSWPCRTSCSNVRVCNGWRKIVAHGGEKTGFGEIGLFCRLLGSCKLVLRAPVIGDVVERHQDPSCRRIRMSNVLGGDNQRAPAEPRQVDLDLVTFEAVPSRPGEVSPRAAHRSGRDTLASSGSCHRTKAAASRRELELLLLPVGSLPTSVTCPLRSTGITPLPRYYGAVRPYPPHRYFRPRSFAACTFSLGIAGQVLKFRTRARTRVMPPIHRAPRGQ